MFDHQDSLDPSDWDAFRRLGHQAMDAMFDYLAGIAEGPVWRQPPSNESLFQTELPRSASGLADCLNAFSNDILPFAVGNAHPGFMGWAHGGGNVVGMLAEMLAAGLNANLGGRDHVPIAVEQQIVAWMRQLFGFPDQASGLLVTGSSMASFIALLIARRRALGIAVRTEGVAVGPPLIAYASTATHGCIARAMDMSGLGSNNLRRIAIDENFRIDLAALQREITADRAAGRRPFCVIGNAGTVDTGAIDDLLSLAELCRREGLWFHIDGACGALGMLSHELSPQLVGIEQADSLALDFHKWAQVPYEAGFVLVRDGQLHETTFAAPAAYLGRQSRGMSAGSPWPCDFGPDLSRGFKALKVWFTFKVFGSEKIGRIMANTCRLARYLAKACETHAELELLAPVSLNIVCFRFRPRIAGEARTHVAPSNEAERELNELNSRILIAIQESGLGAPSSTVIGGQVAIRAAIFNHRTTYRDIDRLVAAMLAIGRELGACRDSIGNGVLPCPCTSSAYGVDNE